MLSSLTFSICKFLHTSCSYRGNNNKLTLRENMVWEHLWGPMSSPKWKWARVCQRSWHMTSQPFSTSSIFSKKLLRYKKRFSVMQKNVERIISTSEWVLVLCFFPCYLYPTICHGCFLLLLLKLYQCAKRHSWFLGPDGENLGNWTVCKQVDG